jgi:hypothetical protein
MRLVAMSLGLVGAVCFACSGDVEEANPSGAGNGGASAAGTAGTAGTAAGGTSAAGTNAGGTNAGGTNAGGTNAGGSAGTGTAGTGTDEPDKHRPQALACDDERPRPEVPDIQGSECSAHSDCTEGRNGRCTTHRFQECTYDACLDDSDCGENELCECEGGAVSDNNVCLEGNCRVDADCPGSYCSPSFGDCGNYSGIQTYYCRTPEDSCLNDSDCTDEPEGYCAFSPQLNRWACSYSHCVG